MSKVTTVVVTRNRREQVLETVARYANPIIVIDNASRDGTVAALRTHFPEVSVISLSTNQGAVARNIGVRAAQTPYVAFADGDSWWMPGTLARACTLLDAHPMVVMLAAAVLDGADARPGSFAEARMRSPLAGDRSLPGVPIMDFMPCACIVRRQPFLDAGGFHPIIGFAGNEERLALDLADAGWALRFVPELVVRRLPVRAVASTRRRARRSARNDVLTALLRRPMKVVWQRIRRHVGGGPDGVAGVLSALWQAPAAMMHRRPLSPRVEDWARRLESTP